LMTSKWWADRWPEDNDGRVSHIVSFSDEWPSNERSCADVVGGQFVAGTTLQVCACSEPGSNKNQEFVWWGEKTTFEV